MEEKTQIEALANMAMEVQAVLARYGLEKGKYDLYTQIFVEGHKAFPTLPKRIVDVKLAIGVGDITLEVDNNITRYGIKGGKDRLVNMLTKCIQLTLNERERW